MDGAFPEINRSGKGKGGKMSIEKIEAWFADCDSCESRITQGHEDRFRLMDILEDIGWKIIKDKNGHIKKVLCSKCLKEDDRT